MPIKPVILTPIYLGIDPGKLGGLVWLTDRAVEVVPMPDTELELWQWFQSLDAPRTVAIIEHVTASPQMGVVSAFTFGGGYFGLRMALTAAAIPFMAVRPQVWQRALGITPRKKTEPSPVFKLRLLSRAQQLFPRLPLWQEPKSKGRQMAIADALLIAFYCRQINRTK